MGSAVTIEYVTHTYMYCYTRVGVCICAYVSGIICNVLQVELPSADLDCSLSQYVDIICSEFDCRYQTISHW